MDESKCKSCQYKQLNGNREKGHCYMFKDAPEDCRQFKAVNVGTIGHVSHSSKIPFQAILRMLSGK